METQRLGNGMRLGKLMLKGEEEFRYAFKNPGEGEGVPAHLSEAGAKFYDETDADDVRGTRRCAVWEANLNIRLGWRKSYYDGKLMTRESVL